MKQIWLFFINFYIDTYDLQDVQLQWLEGEPIEINITHLSLPQFEYLGHDVGHCHEQYITGIIFADIIIGITNDWSCFGAVTSNTS